MVHLQKASGTRSQSRGEPAFSLVELLAAITIILTLTALLIFVTGKVSTRAKSAVCIGNLRQISLAVGSYINDNNGYIPPIQTDMRDVNGSAISTRWWIEIKPYLKYKPIINFSNPESDPKLTAEEKSYVCPQNSRKASRGGAYVNYLGILNASGNTYIPFQTEARKKITSFKNPLSRLPYLLDGYASGNYSYIHPSAVDAYVGIAQAQGDVNTSDPAQGLFKPLHGNNINILYLDGHLESMDIRDFKSTPFDYSRP